MIAFLGNSFLIGPESRQLICPFPSIRPIRSEKSALRAIVAITVVVMEFLLFSIASDSISQLRSAETERTTWDFGA